MPVVLFYSDNNDAPGDWEKALGAHVADLDFRAGADRIGDPAEIDFALVWAPPPGLLARCVNLKAIYGLGQGVDHIFADPQLPADVPLLRIVDPWMSQAMSEWCLMHVLRYHRQGPEYAAIAAAKAWTKLPFPDTAKRRVGIMGLGALGGDLAAKLVGLGFDVRGWSRSAKTLDGVTSYHGADGLADFLAASEIVVNLLPLTRDTRDLMDAGVFAAMPAGSFVINAGRGARRLSRKISWRRSNRARSPAPPWTSFAPNHCLRITRSGTSRGLKSGPMWRRRPTRKPPSAKSPTTSTASWPVNRRSTRSTSAASTKR